MENKEKQEPFNSENKSNAPISEDWYTQALEDMEDFIESQGIYIRQ